MVASVITAAGKYRRKKYNVTPVQQERSHSRREVRALDMPEPEEFP
jgi:hypothetical protein